MNTYFFKNTQPVLWFRIALLPGVEVLSLLSRHCPWGFLPPGTTVESSGPSDSPRLLVGGNTGGGLLNLWASGSLCNWPSFKVVLTIYWDVICGKGQLSDGHVVSHLYPDSEAWGDLQLLDARIWGGGASQGLSFLKSRLPNLRAR